MNVIKKMMIAAGTASVALAPIAATAATPVPATVAARAAPASVDDSELRGRGSGVIIAILAAALIIVGIVIAADEDGDNPVSP